MNTTNAKCIECGKVVSHKLLPVRTDDKGDRHQVLKCDACKAVWEMPMDPSQRAKWMTDRMIGGD